MSIKQQHGSILKGLAIFFALIVIVLLVSGYVVYSRLSASLPDIKTLHDVRYQMPLSIYGKNKTLIAQFGGNKRIPIKIEQVPKSFINAFVAAEDTSFFQHPGVDYKGLIRAGVQLLLTGKKRQGGSTITMQVTRNFLLSNEKTFTRKLKEIILALNIEHEYPKVKILELYLNQIYMGHSAYGIAAAAQTYYGKFLDDLTLAEQAMIAGLPKAPSAYNPITNVNRAMERRNYVLQRMLDLNFISRADFETASNEPSTAKLQYHSSDMSVPYIAEMVRQFAYNKYGEDAYTLGLKIYTTIDQQLQKAAERAVWNALHSYDERHGYRIIKPALNDAGAPAAIIPVIGDTLAATVTQIGGNSLEAKLYNGKAIEIPWEKSKWAVSRAKKYLAVDSPIRVRQSKNGIWMLSQVPEVEGAFISMDPLNGAILTLVGGFEFSQNKFNRTLQAKRQPGSGFKPIIYTTALEQGYTPASMVNDAPITVFDPSTGKNWKPENSTKKFYGPTSIRKGLTYSRNIVAIQLLKEMGIAKGIATGLRFGFNEAQLPGGLSLALGSGYATPLQMARMYSVFANGGFLIDPYFIERIESDGGKLIYQANPKIACPKCKKNETTQQNQAPRIIAPSINFIMNSLMRDVIRQGTATDARVLSRSDIAGKTGTTNDQRDAWFNGFTPTHVASAWVGFDNYKPLGHYETGGVAALPMWIEYMRTALKESPVALFKPPNEVVKKNIGGISDYVQKDVTLKKQAPMPASQKAKAETDKRLQKEKVIKEKPVEALF